MGNVESAATLALAGLCLFLVFAGFSVWKSFSPLGIAQLDLASLRAEAQAIDIQIRLSGLHYEESTLPIAPMPDAPVRAVGASSHNAADIPASPAPALPVTDAPVSSVENTTSAPTLSIDEALFELSQ